MRVEYLYGRKVKDVRKRGTGFTIRFEDDTELVYEDSSVEAPKNLDGLVFTSATFAAERTVLYFGKSKNGVSDPKAEKVELSPMLVGVKDQQGEVHWPARGSEIEYGTPPDPSPERVAEGPIVSEDDDAEG